MRDEHLFKRSDVSRLNGPVKGTRSESKLLRVDLLILFTFDLSL